MQGAASFLKQRQIEFTAKDVADVKEMQNSRLFRRQHLV
jgi:hypothetical protein